MKDKETSEEKVIDELDTMYQRVAEIEREEAAETSIPGEKKPEQKKKLEKKKKRSSRPIIIVASISFIIVAFVLTVTILKPAFILQVLKKGDGHRSIVTLPPAPPKPISELPSVKMEQKATPSKEEEVEKIRPTSQEDIKPPTPPSESLPDQKKQEAMKSTQKEQDKVKPISKEIMKADELLPRAEYYAIQIGAFRDLENARDFTEVLKKEGLDTFWISSKSKNRGRLYKVFVGRFANKNEATGFLKDKKILNDYPDSFIRTVESYRIRH